MHRGEKFLATRRIDLIRAARLACGEEGQEGLKIETFGVLGDLDDFDRRHERFKMLRDLESGTPETEGAAESVARALLTWSGSTKPPVIEG